MKDLWNKGVLILLVIAVLYILYLRECKHPIPCPADNEVIVPRDVWNKIQELANKPPTVHIDTIKIKGDVVYTPTTPLPQPKPEPKDSTINSYADSLVNEEIDVHYNFKVRGELLDRSWKYSPTFTIVKEIDSIPYPILIEVPKPYAKPQCGIYINGIAGGNKSAFLFGGGLNLITKKETLIGYQYQRFGNENFHSVLFGAKIKFGKH
jgi:hypothetical protein